jgi:hypothetical protein
LTTASTQKWRLLKSDEAGRHSLKNHKGKGTLIIGEGRPARWKLNEAAN